MLKRILFSLIVFLGLLPAGHSYAFMTPQLLTHDKFVHMTPEEQEKIIVLAMDYMVELEKRINENKTSTVLRDHWIKIYTIFKTQLENFLISSAYAKPSRKKLSTYAKSEADTNPSKLPQYEKTNWEVYTEKFGALLTGGEGEGKKCFFAGWVSVANAKGVCQHPFQLFKYNQKPDIEIFEHYSKTGGSCKSSEIACNPAIFGYKKATKKTLFCVSALAGQAEKSSFNCRKLALKDNGDDDTDSKADRLKALRGELQKNPEAIQSVYLPMMKSCMCEESHMPKGLNPEYMKKIRPQQTCYGLLGMMSATLSDCKIPSLPGKDEEFAELLKHYQTHTPSDPTGNPDGAQRDLFGRFDKRTASYKYICNGEPIAEKPTCEVKKESCEVNDGKLTCKTFTITRKSGGNSTPSHVNPTPAPACEQSSDPCIFKVAPNPSEALVDCTISAPKKLTCEIKSCKDESDGSKTCDYNIKGEGATPATGTVKGKSKEKPPVEATIDGVRYKVPCTIPDKYECTIDATKCTATTPPSANLKCPYSISKTGDEKFTATEANPDKEVEDVPGKKVVVNFTDNGSKATVECEIPKKPEETKHKCVVSGCTIKTAATTEATAKPAEYTCKYEVKTEAGGDPDKTITYSPAEKSGTLEGVEGFKKTITLTKPGPFTEKVDCAIPKPAAAPEKPAPAKAESTPDLEATPKGLDDESVDEVEITAQMLGDNNLNPEEYEIEFDPEPADADSGETGAAGDGEGGQDDGDEGEKTESGSIFRKDQDFKLSKEDQEIIASEKTSTGFNFKSVLKIIANNFLITSAVAEEPKAAPAPSKAEDKPKLQKKGDPKKKTYKKQSKPYKVCAKLKSKKEPKTELKKQCFIIPAKKSAEEPTPDQPPKEMPRINPGPIPLQLGPPTPLPSLDTTNMGISH